MSKFDYELKKWLVLNTDSLLNAKSIYDKIKDWGKKDIELYKSLFDGYHYSTIEKMNFVKGVKDKFQEFNDLYINDLLYREYMNRKILEKIYKQRSK